MTAAERVLSAIGELRDAADGTSLAPAVAAVVAALADDTTAVDARQDVEFLKAAIHQDAEWARECLAGDGFIGGRSTRGGDRALTYIKRIAERTAP